MNLPENHPNIQSGRLGVLLVNLGTPDATDYWSVRRYLKEFLSDRRVIELHPLLWLPILYGPILTFRPAKSALAYRKIWHQETNESPLRFYTRRQADLLQTQMPDVIVDWAMRYGNPSIASRIELLAEQGCNQLLVLPLYPQYSATTSASVADAVFAKLQKMRWQPTLRIARPWHDHPAHIQALAANLNRQLAGLTQEPDALLLSFHGLPQKYFTRGDPYHCHCQKTARLLREALGWSEDRVLVSFQSRLGPTEWLQPYTASVLAELPQKGIKSIAVATPGFVTDCVETLEEIALEGKEIFMHAGGEHYQTLACLNDSDESIGMLQALANEELAGWRKPPND